MNIPRPEHPKPQFQRENWMNLNGFWGFEIDNSCSGLERGYFLPDWKPQSQINVPFCPESKLSGIEHKDFILGVWYQKKIELTAEQCKQRIVLHFGAVDYSAQVYINGTEIGSHKGGYVSFCFEISDYVQAGENTITIFAQDDTRCSLIPSGKQSSRYLSYDCNYTRTSGIWQTVWLEFTPDVYIDQLHIDTDVKNGIVILKTQLHGVAQLQAEVSYQGRSMGSVQMSYQGGTATLSISLHEIYLWELGHGRLYDLDLTYGEDHVKSYFGMRSIRMDDTCFYLNDRPVFQRLVLDQGFYPDGVYTAPTDEALRNDIELAMAMGFNGARPHEKIFEERYLYHCDQKGYIVWGEYPNWGLDHTNPMAIYSILPEWLEQMKRDYNHPSIIGWCPFNETWDIDHRKQYDDLLRLIYRTTKTIDPTRPCIDSSGNFHVQTDIFDVHDYEQDPEVFRSNYNTLVTDGTLFNSLTMPKLRNQYDLRQKYTGGPTFLSEYGGIQWSTDKNGWGYGNAPESIEEFRKRLKGLTDALLDNPKMMGLCYTQLTDVEQEQNGLYTYDRHPKLDPDWVHSVFSRPAAIEKVTSDT